ncbi:hypothetical protein AB0I84_09420 [Streptomyces spectabilis]|uniref:hypothetical protein n=1 Tax=Streptomyces spectabilis TaxID=68270 RepID=UPI0033C65374
MTTTTVDRSQWVDQTPDDRRIPWRKVTAPDTRSGPVSTHPTMGEHGMVHTAPWWADGVLFTDNGRWLGHLREQAAQARQTLTIEDAPAGPPAEHREQVDALRRYAELHTMHPARPLPLDEHGQPVRVRFY